ncbi:protein kinase domain-containing protein [Nannocystaceae bacterium ST9]
MAPLGPPTSDALADAVTLADANDPTSTVEIGTIGRFVITGRIGSGGMGVVLRGHDPMLARPVAIKVLHPTSPRAGEPDARARLLAEAQAMARVTHPNVVAVYDVGVLDEGAFVAMELVEGDNLHAWLHAATRSWTEVIDTFVAAGRGLAAVHAAGLVHRDFKPGNVLVGRDGRVRVVDFGLATGLIPNHEASPPDPLHGTPRYMSPEQSRGELVDARSDQWSFCVALAEALDGTPPFAADARALARVRAAIARGLALDPAARWPSMDALVGELERAGIRRRTWPIVVALAISTALAITVSLIQSTRDLDPLEGGSIPSSPTARTDFFVDAAASGLPTGDADHPFPSISAALEAAERSSAVAKRIHVAAGIYDGSRETFPLELRHGVSLIGEGPELTMIVGSGRHDHVAGGTATGSIQVAILVGDPLAPQTIRGISLRPADGDVEPWGIYCDRGNGFPPPADDLDAPANLILDQLAVTDFDRSIIVGTSDRPAPSGCAAVLTRSRVSARRVGVFIAGAGFGSNSPNRVRARLGGPSASEGNQFIGSRNPERIGLDRRAWPTAVQVLDQSTPVVIRHNTFSDNDVALEFNSFNPELVNEVDDNTFTAMSVAALSLAGNAHLRSLTNNYFADNVAGPELARHPDARSACGEGFGSSAALCLVGYGEGGLGPQIDRARGNTFAGNDVGIHIEGTPFVAERARQLDFGRTDDPGRNRFICNSTQTEPESVDLWLELAGGETTLAFFGNQWDHAPPGPSDLRVEPGGPLVDIAGADVHGMPCPTGHRD